MMADSSQARIVGKIDVRCCTLVGGSRVRSLMRTPFCTLDRRRFGLRTIAMLPAFCLLRLSFAASCLSASNLRLALLTDERQLSRSEATYCHD